MWQVLLLLAVSSQCRGQSAINFTHLQRNLITIDPRVRPAEDSSNQIQVTVAFHLMSIADFDTVNQKLVSNGWLQVVWRNPYMVWDPNDYGGVSYIYPDPETVWRPRLTVQNTMKDLKPLGEDYVFISVFSDGSTAWFLGERFETFCSVDVTYFPFDSQRCQWKMFIWGDSSNQTDLRPASDEIDLDTFSGNGEWELMSTRAWQSVTIVPTGIFPFLFYEVTLRRRPTLTVLTGLLPVLVLALINIYVFAIPSESGERLSYAITALLSFGVFMSFILDSMPSATETISIVAIHMSALLVLSAVYVLCCILTLRLFHRDDAKHPVPQSLQSVIVWLEVLLCLEPPASNKIDVIRVASLDHSDDVNNKGVKQVPRKWRHDAYADPAEMTWRRVSRSLDKLLFRFFFFLLLVSTVVIIAIVLSNY